MRLRAADVTGVAVLLISCAGQAPLAPPPLLESKLPASPPALSATGKAVPAPASPSPSTAELPSPYGVTGAPPVSLGDIGGAGRIQLLAASTSGAWVALCDGDGPSQGQGKTAKLVLGSGSGEAIDELLAQDPSGRYVVSSRAGVTYLIDANSSRRVNLSELAADVRRVRADYAEHRTLSFDAAGRYFAYLRQQGQAAQVVLRTLETGSEQTFSAGSGEVFRLRLSADARYVTLEVLREDSNKNGKLDWPAPEEQQSANACERPAFPKFRSFAYQGRGDGLTRAVLSVADGALRDVPGLVTPLGQSLLVREADGSLQLDRAGKRTALSPPSCAARVLFADAERGLVLATCTPPPPPASKKSRATITPAATGKRDVWLFAAGYAKNLQSELYETATDRDAVLGVRLVPLYPGSDASLLDLERREVLPLASGSRVVTTSGALALIWRDNDLYRYDAETKTEQRLAHGVLKNPDLLQAGNNVLLSPFVVIGVTGPALPSPSHALSLSTTGFVLTASGAGSALSSSSVRGAIQGPLHWVDARLPPPDGPPR